MLLHQWDKVLTGPQISVRFFSFSLYYLQINYLWILFLIFNVAIAASDFLSRRI